jgi:hypothetical protein
MKRPFKFISIQSKHLLTSATFTEGFSQIFLPDKFENMVSVNSEYTLVVSCTFFHFNNNNLASF